MKTVFLISIIITGEQWLSETFTQHSPGLFPYWNKPVCFLEIFVICNCIELVSGMQTLKAMKACYSRVDEVQNQIYRRAKLNWCLDNIKSIVSHKK